jgi:hypothetical protein
MKRIFSLFIVVCLIYSFAYSGSLSLDLCVDPVYDSNVYKDSSNLSDTGWLWDLGINYYTRINNTYPRILYRFSGVDFVKNNSEDFNTHSLTGMVMQRTGHFVTLGLEAGANLYSYNYMKEYNSSMYYGSPFMRLYPTFFTEIEIAYTPQVTKFPDYDLDNKGSDVRIQLTQEIFWYMTLVISGSQGNKEYSERYLYDTSISNTPVKTVTARSDNEKSVIVKLKRFFEGLGMFELGYYNSVLDSNANEFNWGPFQTELSDIPGDESIIDNYWSNTINNINICYETGNKSALLVEVYVHIQDQKFPGWIARDEYEEFLNPIVYRTDQQIISSIKLEKRLWKIISANTKYTFEQNNSNDKPYDYVAHTISGGMSVSF